MGDGPAHHWVTVDSLQVAALPDEDLVTTCGRSSASRAGDTVALVAESSRTTYRQPRLAWFLDVRSNRIRSIAVESLMCTREVPAE